MKDPSKRIGNKADANEIKKHPFFENINFEDILKKKIRPPLSDILKDFYYFDKKLLNKPANDSPIKST